jgi:hypothetical protein
MTNAMTLSVREKENDRAHTTMTLSEILVYFNSPIKLYVPWPEVFCATAIIEKETPSQRSS